MAGLWPLPRLIAHRGGGSLAPENTLAGIRQAARHGYRAVEFDVILSADSVPVLIHDETLARTSNGRGRVAEQTYAQLSLLDAGSRFGVEYSGEAIPRIDHALGLCRSLGMAVNVEIKPSPGAESATGRVVAEWTAEYGRGMPLVLSSFSLTALREAQKAAPDLPRGVLFDAPPVDWLGIVRRAGAVSMHCNWRHLRADTLAAARAAELPLLVYTCNHVQHARDLLARGVASLVTDRLDLVSDSNVGNL